MAIIKSVFLGSPGTYNFFGLPVIFKETFDEDGPYPDFKKAGLISYMATKCIESQIFKVVTQSYMHLLVHELSHAAAARFILNRSVKEIEIFSNSGLGHTVYDSSFDSEPEWKQTLINVSGAIGNIAFCFGQLAFALLLKSTCWPLALLIAAGALIWIASKLLYAYYSAFEGMHGDFGDIAKSGRSYLLVSSAAVITECALGILALALIL